jgi:hypothetical protein
MAKISTIVFKVECKWSYYLVIIPIIFFCNILKINYDISESWIFKRSIKLTHIS